MIVVPSMARSLACRQPHWPWDRRLLSLGPAVSTRLLPVASSLSRSRQVAALCTRPSMATSVRLPLSTFLSVLVPSHGTASTAQSLQARCLSAPRSRWQALCLHLLLAQRSPSKELEPTETICSAWGSLQNLP